MDSKQIKYTSGTVAWHNSYGRLHREDGPAILSSSGNRYWYLNGTRLSFDEWCDHLDINEKRRLLLQIQYG